MNTPLRRRWNRCEICGEPTTRVQADIAGPAPVIRVICGLCEAAGQGLPYESARFGEGRQLSVDDFDRIPCSSCGAPGVSGSGATTAR